MPATAEKSIAPDLMARYEPVIGLEVHAQLERRPRPSAPAQRASAIRRTRMSARCAWASGCVPRAEPAGARTGLSGVTGAGLQSMTRALRGRTTSIPTCPRAIRFPCMSCRWLRGDRWKSSAKENQEHRHHPPAHGGRRGQSLHEGFPDSAAVDLCGF